MRERLSPSRALSLLVAVISIALVAACSASPDPTPVPAAATGSTSVETPSPDPSVRPGADPLTLPSAHVHAIARDPGSSKLLVAAHDGLYVYDGATPKRVGPVIDLMGFTVAGPGHYYASGHPGTATDLPQPVGLIESRDGGNTWTVLSRGGGSDFHALTTAGSTVVGFDGVLRSTADGRTWREGNLDAQPRTLAGSRNGSTVLATTPEGLMHSIDAGLSWRWTEQAPLLLMVAFGDGDTVAGLTPDGQVHTSTDAGRTWRATELLAPDAQALHASGEGEQLEILVANDRTILASSGGQPFQPLR
ncbi:F510_1955 family glycosylhydrolase [Nostocoides sp.]|uniref:F510_1955 family glycosylhydrolase n=1 Tax=Nostocoides sp. TaxID=1917966 RepID=UPI003BB00CF8